CFSTISKKYDGNFSRFADDMFSESLFTDSTRMMTFLSGFRKKDIGKIERDPAFQLSSGIYYRYEQTVTFALNKLNNRIDSLQRIYMAAQMAMQKDKRFYPDANLTMRVSYGQVKGYNPADAVSYNYFTTSDGILQKEDTSVYDYAIPQKLHQMFLKKDFGRYADADGTLHISFIAGNHTTGGMSGSPVLNADGQLIGLNFDRNWEGTQSDLMYDPDQCRNIILDIRYCLFIIDRYAGAKRLVDELVIRGTQVE
ncbi:MAG: S46 family peptidase, partial [Bacteroidota bacterium]|nr:S46 family peptidase [Bacteroidota bacterium]